MYSRGIFPHLVYIHWAKNRKILQWIMIVVWVVAWLPISKAKINVFMKLFSFTSQVHCRAGSFEKISKKQRQKDVGWICLWGKQSSSHKLHFFRTFTHFVSNYVLTQNILLSNFWYQMLRLPDSKSKMDGSTVLLWHRPLGDNRIACAGNPFP